MGRKWSCTKMKTLGDMGMARRRSEMGAVESCTVTKWTGKSQCRMILYGCVDNKLL